MPRSSLTAQRHSETRPSHSGRTTGQSIPSSNTATLTEARDAAEHAHALADQLGQPTLLWFNCFQRAALELLHGDLAAAERLAEQAFQLGKEAGQPDAVLIYGGQIDFIRPYQGRGDEIIEMRQSRRRARYAGVPSFRAALA